MVVLVVLLLFSFSLNDLMRRRGEAVEPVETSMERALGRFWGIEFSCVLKMFDCS